MEKVFVELGARSYPIFIGTGILPSIGQHCRDLRLGQKIMIVSNPVVYGLYGEAVRKSLEDSGYLVSVAEVPDGENYKSLEWAAKLFDHAFEIPLDRKDTILALGGGVIGDLAGFVAATYMRGVNFIQVPTTLLAQVDSSVGGKVAVNHPRGKNIIGAFYQPRLVLADVGTLSSLPLTEFSAGLAEVVKYGVIWDNDFFCYLEEKVPQILAKESSALTEMVRVSCSIKAKVVSEDETEQGLRAILNYGHTFGHAIEALTGYGTYGHGAAVAIGMVTAAKLGVRTGIFNASDVERLGKLLQKFGLPVTWPALVPGEVYAKMYLDKKVEQGKLRLVVPEAIGRVRVTGDIAEKDVMATLHEMLGI